MSDFIEPRNWEPERRRGGHVQRYRPPLPTNWREAKRLHDEEAISKTRIIAGADMTKIVVDETVEVAIKAQQLAKLGFPELAQMAVGGFFYKGNEVRDDYMDGR